MKALSLWQPHATLMAIRAKHIETRSWATAYRGPVAIHATVRIPPEALALLTRRPFVGMLSLGGYAVRRSVVNDKLVHTLPLGKVVSVGILVACVPTEQVFDLNPRLDTPEERAFGDYSPGRFAWVFTEMEKVKPPAPARGKQGLWEWEAPSGTPHLARKNGAS